MPVFKLAACELDRVGLQLGDFADSPCKDLAVSIILLLLNPNFCLIGARSEAGNVAAALYLMGIWHTKS